MLRERGQTVEAGRLETQELPGLLEALHSDTETAESVAARVADIFARESERVADAAVLAELLAPLLRQTAFVDTPLARAVEAATPSVPDATVETVAAPARPRPGNIADFIDEMIAQERPPDRTTRGARRAS